MLFIYNIIISMFVANNIQQIVLLVESVFTNHQIVLYKIFIQWVILTAVRTKSFSKTVHIKGSLAPWLKCSLKLKTTASVLISRFDIQPYVFKVLFGVVVLLFC